MGIRDLNKFLQESGIKYEKHRPSYFAKHTIAIDGYSLFFRIYYAAKKQGYKNHQITALKLFQEFLDKWPKTTTLIFVLDNQQKSELKAHTLAKRRGAEEALQEDIKKLRLAIKEEPGNPVLHARLEALKQRTKDTFRDVALKILALLETLGYKYQTAPGEAEKLACELAKQGEVDYVYSNDTDCLALSCPAVIFDDVGGFLHLYRLSTVLEVLELSPEQFTDFCILLGTDFNERVQSPREAYENIAKYQSIENIPGISPELLKDLQQVRMMYH
jgi:5'-3' exonuclease